MKTLDTFILIGIVAVLIVGLTQYVQGKIVSSGTTTDHHNEVVFIAFNETFVVRTNTGDCYNLTIPPNDYSNILYEVSTDIVGGVTASWRVDLYANSVLLESLTVGGLSATDPAQFSIIHRTDGLSGLVELNVTELGGTGTFTCRDLGVNGVRR